MKLYGYRNVLNGHSIIDHFKKQGLKNLSDPLSLHVTIIYSKKDINEQTIKLDNKQLSITSKCELDIFGEYFVMKINSKILQKRFEYFKDKGCSWDYDYYRPHITLSNTPQCIDSIIPYSGKIILGEEKMEKLSMCWKNEDNIAYNNIL